MNQFDRVFQLHTILSKRRSPLSLRELADRMECSRATVFRTITLLKDNLGAPVVFDKERDGYRYDRTDDRQYELPGLWFNARELQALVTIQRLLEELGGGLLEEHFAMLTRRIAELTSRKQLNLGEVATRIRMPALASRATGPAFQDVVSATLQRKKLEIEYRARTTDQLSHRIVSPQRVTRYRESWYLDAWDEEKQALRTFAIDRIGQVRIVDEAAHTIEEDVLDEHFASGYGIFSGKADKVAVLLFSQESARWVAAEQWHPRQEGRFLPDGRYELRIPYGLARELVMDILRHGPDVKVLEPPSLALEVKAQLARALDQYSAG
jgi:proteasome accessory factor C